MCSQETRHLDLCSGADDQLRTKFNSNMKLAHLVALLPVNIISYLQCAKKFWSLTRSRGFHEKQNENFLFNKFHTTAFLNLLP